MASRVHCLKRIGENVKKYRTVILEGKDEATIGRSPDATLCILSVMISRCHAILKKSETGAWTIKDNKSLNGVFVNDKKLEPLKPYELNEGDIVQFGVREKPDTPPEFLYRYHTALKLSRKVDQTDGPVANSQVKRIKLEGEKVSNTSSVSPSKSKQETSPYQQYRQKIDEQDAQTTAKMSQLEEKLKEMQQLLQEKEAAQQEMAMELQEEKTKRENQSKALECLKKKEEDMQHELVKQQELLTKEKEELESRMREELEDQLQAKEADLMENLENQKTALLKEKEEIENRLKEQLETEREKDKQLADELMQQKQKLEKIIENKEVEKKLLESQLKDTTLEKDQKQEEVLRAREDVLSNFAELMETELQCSICNELFVKATSLNCSHSFCFLCISQWLKVKNECPQCRSAVTTCTKSIVLDSYIEKMVEQFSEDMKRSRQELVEERKKEEAAFEEANKPKPPATRGGRGRGRGRAGRGRGQANTAASTRAPNPTVFNPPPPLPILISDETSDEIDGDNDGFVSLSDEENSDSDSSVEGDGDVYYGGYGRCYNCGISSSQTTDGTGQDNYDDEICYGSLRGNVVGLQYYRGTVNHNEMVALQREPHNKYDINAIKVNNVAGQQVGHIKRELARPLAFVLDKGLARVEGIVPFGQSNVYTMPVDLTLWGKPENQKAVVDKLKHNGFYLSSTPKSNNKSGASTSQDYSNFALASPSPRQTYLSPAEIKNELDNLYETLEEGDKTTEADPAQAVSTGLYPHQKQALHWMMLRENTQTLPPFWVERQKKYFNNVLNFTTDKRPESVKGGILADDMGLGKTLEVISLIVTNFVDKQPLAIPINGLVRQNRRDKLAMDKAKGLPTSDSLSCTQRKSFTPVLKPHCSGVVGEKKLPQLPILIDDDDDDDTRTPEVYNEDDVVLDEKVMTAKDDPNFSPIQTNKKSNEKTVSSPLVSRRPKRKIKKPVKYNYSSDENVDETCESPMKRVKPNPDADRGKAPVRGGRGRKKGKLKVESSNNQKKSNANQDIGVDGKSQDKENRIDLTVDKKNLQIDEPTKEKLPDAESNTTTLPDLKELNHGTIVSKDCHDDLPDLENVLLQDGKVFNIDDTSSYITPDYSKPCLSETGPSTGRTPTTGPRCTLIVCPMSVLSNWLDQFEMHVHRNVHLNIYLYYGSSRTKKYEDLMRQDVVLTTYSTVAADFKKGARNPLKKVKWLRIVLDEGHTIKNPNAQQTKAICELDAERRWILSGTPIQNSMKDLWSLINFLKISPFTDRYWWRRTIERPLTHGNKDGLKRLQLLMGNISMRRTKTQKLNGKPIVTLPERHVYIEHVKFSDEEKAVYEAMQKDGKLIVSKYFKQGTLLHNYGDVLAILMRLRQLCCHPFLVAKAAEAVKETMAELEKTGGEVNDELRQKLIGTLMMVLSSGTDEECAICLDSLKSAVITQCAHVYCRACIESVIQSEKPRARCPLCRGELDANKLLEVPPEREGPEHQDNLCMSDTWKPSAKVDALMNALNKVRAEDCRTKSIVVSQFTSLLTLLEVPLTASGFSFVRLDGTMNSKARIQAIEQFSSEAPDSPTIILLSLKAGGVGINLTAASRVFLIDPAWNPASEEQCFDRCHRLGQKKDVVITKFIVEDSVEVRMLELQEKKRKLMTGAFGTKQTAEQKRQDRINDIKTLFNF